MRQFAVSPSAHVSGELAVPGDKSISHRALMLSGIASGTSEVSGFLSSEDCLATLAAMRALGVRIEAASETRVQIHGAGLHGLSGAARALDMGNAGTAMRLFAGLLAAQSFDSTLIGDASLMKRPMERVAVPLRQMGADVRTVQGLPPVSIVGAQRLHGIDYRMPVASAQVKSAILLAGLYAQGTTTLSAPGISRDHTERMLAGRGVHIDSDRLQVILHPAQRLEARDVQVPGDFSSAAFFLVAALLGAAAPGLLLRNVGLNPTRTGLLTILQAMGGRIEVRNERSASGEPVADLCIYRSALRGIDVDPGLVPLAIDELPVLFIAAACAAGTTRVTGAQELRVKESDRIAAMSAALAQLGVQHEVLDDGMVITGNPGATPFRGARIDSHGDHRIAMSCCIAALRSSAPLQIDDVANVATSFPGFAPLARSVGLAVHEAADP